MKNGVVMDRLTAGIAGYSDPHIEMAVSDHPGEQFERVCGVRVRWCQRQVRQVFPNLLSEIFALLNGLDFRRIQCAANDQAHVAAVSHQALDAARRESECLGVEIPGQAIVALGVLECGDIEELDEIAVLGSVFALP